jgi:hypothetical protein
LAAARSSGIGPKSLEADVKRATFRLAQRFRDGEATRYTLSQVYTFLEIAVLRTGALALLTISIYKQVRKHWRQR